MNELLEPLERMGPRGGLIMVGLAAVALLVAGLVFAMSMDALGLGLVSDAAGRSPEQARWLQGGLRFAASMAFVVSLPLAFVGVRLLTQRQYPSASEVFPPLSVNEITEALAAREGDQCVCTRCRVMVPADFSTGSCPVCASSVEYHEVCTDEDARMVLAALS